VSLAVVCHARKPKHSAPGQRGGSCAGFIPGQSIAAAPAIRCTRVQARSPLFVLRICTPTESPCQCSIAHASDQYCSSQFNEGRIGATGRSLREFVKFVTCMNYCILTIGQERWRKQGLHKVPMSPKSRTEGSRRRGFNASMRRKNGILLNGLRSVEPAPPGWFQRDGVPCASPSPRRFVAPADCDP